MTLGKKQACAPYDPPGSGPKHPGKDLQRNVGKDPLPAGAGRNLQRPLDISAEHEDPAEEGGLAHELVGARTEGNALLGGAGHHPGASNAGDRQRSSGHLAVSGWSTTWVGGAILEGRAWR